MPLDPLIHASGDEEEPNKGPFLHEVESDPIRAIIDPIIHASKAADDQPSVSKLIEVVVGFSGLKLLLSRIYNEHFLDVYSKEIDGRFISRIRRDVSYLYADILEKLISARNIFGEQRYNDLKYILVNNTNACHNHLDFKIYKIKLEANPYVTREALIGRIVKDIRDGIARYNDTSNADYEILLQIIRHFISPQLAKKLQSDLEVVHNNGQLGEPVGPDDQRERKKGLKPDDLTSRVQARISELSEYELADLWNYLATRPPGKAPELWSNRTSGREVSPADFVKSVYHDWLETISLRYLGHVDPALYNAYNVWINRHPEDDLKLPKEPRRPGGKSDSTTSLKSARKTAYVPTADLPEEERARRRSYDAGKKREKRASARLSK